MKHKYTKLIDKLEKILYKPQYLFQVNYDGKDLYNIELPPDDEEVVIVTYKI